MGAGTEAGAGATATATRDVGERFTFGLDDAGRVLGHPRGAPRRRRVFADQFAHELRTYPERTRAPGGITGLAQVHDLRGDTSIEERARFDNRYIDQYSLFLDLLIALRTIGSLFRSKEVY